MMKRIPYSGTLDLAQLTGDILRGRSDLNWSTLESLFSWYDLQVEDHNSLLQEVVLTWQQQRETGIREGYRLEAQEKAISTLRDLIGSWHCINDAQVQRIAEEKEGARQQVNGWFANNPKNTIEVAYGLASLQRGISGKRPKVGTLEEFAQRMVGRQLESGMGEVFLEGPDTVFPGAPARTIYGITLTPYATVEQGIGVAVNREAFNS